MRRLLPCAVLALALGSAQADWTASGRFEYVDRPYNLNGFTGEEPPRPVRLADFEIIDANRNGNSAVLARGATGPDGSFSVLVEDTKTRDVYVRVTTSSDETSDLFVEVKSDTGNNSPLYAATTTTLLDHAPAVSVDFGTSTIQLGQGAEAFNIYDQLLVGTDFLALLNGARPGSSDSLTAVWGYQNGLGVAYYAGFGTIMLRDSAAFDDTVILHEMGHYAIERFSDSDNPGGSHGFSQCDQDVRLAYDEGFATYWGNAALRHAGTPGSHVYLRTNGGPGAGNAVRSADLESDGLYQCRGTASEVNVFMLLWDITDGVDTGDSTPGLDDSHDLLSLPDSEVWEVVTGHVSAGNDVSLRDFWDGWFLAPASNGYIPEMQALARRLAIGHYPDEVEPNDEPPQAAGISTTGRWVDATFFSDPDSDGAGATDVDLFAFEANDAQPVRVRTFGLSGETETLLEVLDEAGLQVLAVGETGTVVPDSLLTFVPPSHGRYLVRVTQSAPLAVYGSYRLSVLKLGGSHPVPEMEAGSTFPTEIAVD